MTVHRGHILGIGAVLMVPVAVVAHLGLAPLLLVVAVLLVAEGVVRRRPGPFRATVGRSPLVVLSAAFLALAALSALWSRDPGLSLETAFRVAGTFLAGWVALTAAVGLDDGERRVFERLLIAGGIGGLVWLPLESATGGALLPLLLRLAGAEVPHGDWFDLRLNTAYVVLALLLLPLTATVAGRWGRLAAALVAGWGVVVLALWSESQTPLAALAAGGVVAGLGRLAPRPAAAALAIGMVMVTAAFPVASRHLPRPEAYTREIFRLPNSLLARFQIWRTAAEHIRERPLLGLGFDTTRTLYGRGDIVRYVVVNPETGVLDHNVDQEPIPLHPHSAILQVYLELGVVGAVVGLALVLVPVWTAARRPSAAAALILGLTASTAAVAAMSFGAWQFWWLSGVWLVAVCAAGSRAGPAV